MSKSEDYLDGLLDAVDVKKRVERELEKVEKNPEDEFLDSFEKEFLSGDDADEFIRQFERELDAEEERRSGGGQISHSGDDMFFDNLDGIVNSVKEKMKEPDGFPLPEELSLAQDGDMDLMVDTIGDMGGDDFAIPQDDFSMPQDEFSSDEGLDLMGGFGAADAFDSPDNVPDMDDVPDMGSGDFAIPQDDFSMDDMSGLMDGFGAADALDLPGDAPGMGGDDADLMNLLQSEGDFSDLGDLLPSGGGDMPIDKSFEESFGDFSMDEFDAELAAQMAGESEPVSMPVPEEESEGKKRTKKAKKQKVKKQADTEKEQEKGFFQRMSEMLFGGDEEEETAAKQPVKAAPAAALTGMDDLSDENLQILQALEGGGTVEPESVPEAAEDPKEKKKREKKEKQAKAKAEKKEKKEQAKKAREEKKAKKLKEKKPKPPKEPDRTPPLPKKPVFLIYFMAASFLGLVILGTNLFGYSSGMANAEKEFGLGNYETAFQEVAGMEIKEEDIALYEKYRLMANVSGQYSAYQSFMEAKIYDMALDTLIRTVGRCEKYRPDAEVYACTGELTKMREKAVGALASFGINEQSALALYAESDREVYSTELYAILAETGFEVK